jgi:hypothetical protein
MNYDYAQRAADPATRGGARLIAYIINQAIVDAAKPLKCAERKAGENQDEHAIEALDWLFTPGTAFEAYAHLLGMDPDYLRRALLKPASPDAAQVTERARSTIRERLALRASSGRNLA